MLSICVARWKKNKQLPAKHHSFTLERFQSSMLSICVASQGHHNQQICMCFLDLESDALAMHVGILAVSMY
eukprot:7692374-Lingulodinium_polyedra.AAC.2